MQENDSILCGYFRIGFIDFMVPGKKTTDITNLFCHMILRKAIV